MDDFSLLPAPERQSDRYAARPTQRAWATQEDLCLLPVLLACESEHAYLSACRVLCEILGRKPVYPATAKPTTKILSDDCQALVERRTVTEILDGEEAPVEMLNRLSGGFRDTEEDLTWAEKVKFIQPFARKQKKKNTRLDFGGLLKVLNRSHRGGYKMVTEYIEEFNADRHRDYPINLSEMGYAHSPKRELGLAKHITRFVGENRKGRELLTRWNQLCQYCIPLDNGEKL